MRIVFVCTGNTCRSPMAEALLRQKYPHHEVISAGLSVLFPSPAAENACRVMEDYGLDLSSHRSRQLTASMVTDADLVLTMTRGHKAILHTLFPSQKEKIHSLCEYAGQSGDVEDPFGGDLDVYRECAGKILELCEVLPL